MPGWLHSPRLALYLALFAALLLSLSQTQGSAAADQHPSVSQPQQAQPQPQSLAPQTLPFVNGVATVQGAISSNQPQDYLFFAAQGQTVRIQLQSSPVAGTFQVTGVANGVTYKQFDGVQDWTFTLPVAQNYRITVNSPLQPIVFNLTVTLDGGGGQPQRLTFNNNGQAEAPGSAASGISPQYLFFANAGQQVRVNLISAGNLANFSVRGVVDNVVYKQPTDPTRDWTFTLPTSQDYVITVSSPTPVGFTLQVTLPGGTGPTPGATPIAFAPGQTNAVVNGSLQPTGVAYYSFQGTAGQQLRLLLTAAPSGSINFALNGLNNGVVYKQLTDPSREFTLQLPVTQSYLITLFNFSGGPATYTLEVSLSGALPPPITPTFTPIPPPPSGCTVDTIQNGGFEFDGFWVFGDTEIKPVYTSANPHTGLRSVRMGIDPALGAGLQNAKSFSSVRQPFQIPAEASIAQLRWWNFYRTEEAQTDSPGLGQDKQEVVLLKPDLSTVAVLRSVRRNNNAWIEELVDLTPYRGQSLLLYFNVYNDGNGQRTWQFLDDVQIAVCYPAVTATPFVPTPVPTQFPTAMPPTFVAPTFVFPTVVAPTFVFPTLVPTGAIPTFVFPTPIPPTGIAPTLVFPTVIAPTGIAPTLVFPTFPAVTPLAGAQLPGTEIPLLPGIGLNGQLEGGEPDIVVLPPGGAAPAVSAAGAVVEVDPALMQVNPTATPVPPVTTQGGLRLFDRPAGEVLTWGAIMLGALAIIGILVALIWQAGKRNA